jgi:hypothetical protein
MTTFNSLRRDFLRTGGLGMAATALPAVSLAGSRQKSAPAARPAFYLSDIDRADFFAVTAPRTADGAFILHDVKDLRIGWSRAAADTTLATTGDNTL